LVWFFLVGRTDVFECHENQLFMSCQVKAYYIYI